MSTVRALVRQTFRSGGLGRRALLVLLSVGSKFPSSSNLLCRVPVKFRRRLGPLLTPPVCTFSQIPTALELNSGRDLCLREIATSRVSGTVPIRSQCSGWVVRGWVHAPVGCFGRLACNTQLRNR